MTPSGLHPGFANARAALPRLGSPERARLGLERWAERAGQAPSPDLADFAQKLAEDSDGRALLEAIFANSPFLTHAVLSDPGFLKELLEQGIDVVFAELLGRIDRARLETRDRPKLMASLRIARRQAALAVALADIAGIWPLERVCAGLSAFAEHALGAAAAHLLTAAAAAGDLVLRDPAAPELGSGLILIAMGKLGAGELNYSSDIDLIVLFETERVTYTGKRDIRDFFIRLTRDLVKILQDRTEDGYVFRVDLRLRPDPASTAVAMSALAAETYYESMGQNWERAAMIKARAIAGDIEAGQIFLDRLRPYVWRKHLDFAAIQDIHSIKRQIQAHRGHQAIAVAGHNIKLGRGGIREIEFYAQTQQLIWGGRMASLRVRDTRGALRALKAAGRVSEEAARAMDEAYVYLRTLEHRLQMVDDQQTQTLPPQGPALEALGRFMGFASSAGFAEALTRRLETVEEHYAHLFEEAPDLAGPGDLVFTGTENDPETVKTLERLGFTDGASVAATVRGWHHGRYRAMRSTRARELLTELMPSLLGALARTPHPDAAFNKFDEFLGNLPAGVQIFSLIHAHPEILDLLAEILGGAPRLAEHLSRRPVLLDAVLAPGFFEAPADRATLGEELSAELAQARDFQDVLDISRRWTNDRKFQIGAAMLRHRLDPERAGLALSDLADAVIDALIGPVEREFARLHGRVAGGAFAVVALGRLGSREMTMTSDLDLLFLYEAADETTPSDGAKPLAPTHYYARLSQRLINALSALTGEGRLYEVDMRLRPSGNAGPIACQIDGFQRYQESEAWTWEHMALTRARAVAGTPSLATSVERMIARIVRQPRDPDRLRSDVAAMRARIGAAKQRKSPWDVKYRPGGLVDLDFIIQYLILREAARHPELTATSTETALRRLGEAGILDLPSSALLIEAGRLWRRLQAAMRLMVGSDRLEGAMPESLERTLCRFADAVDMAALQATITATAAGVARLFEVLIGRVAAPDGSSDSENMREETIE